MDKPDPANTSKVSEAYSAQYAAHDDRWRMLGGRNKATNIIALCTSLKARTMLDVGSGDGSVLAWLSAHHFIESMVAMDISPSARDRILERKIPQLQQFTLYDGYTIPFPTKKFDLATCSHVMEHVEHPRLLLREIGRVSTYQFFEIPIDFSFFVDKKIEHFLAYGHINIFTPALFRFLLKSEGFEVIREDFRFYSSETLALSFPQWKKRWVNRFKNQLIATWPWLKKIKPNVYIVLCKKSNQGLKIF